MSIPLTTEDLCRPRWNRGQLLAFSALEGTTDYALGLVARTTELPHGIEITDPEQCRILFADAPAGDVVMGGDFFQFRGAYSETRGVFLDAHHLLVEGPCTISGGGGSVSRREEGSRCLLGTGSHFKPELIDADLDASIEARCRWILSRELPANTTDVVRRTLVRAFSVMKTQVYSPEGRIRHRWTTPDRWPHKDMWLWDTAFHAIGWRHIDPVLAREMIDGMFDLQRDDGFLTYRGAATGSASHLGEKLTQPPVLSLAVKLVEQTAGDERWMERLYPKLCAYIEWDLAHRDTDGGGLAEWYIEDDVHCRAGESGMDNSPRFDSAQPLDAVDFNSYLANECQILAEFARRLGKSADSRKWINRYERLCHLINAKLWSEEHHFYCDSDPHGGKLKSALSSAGFMPLLCGAATPERAGWLARHLIDPDMFATGVPIPSIAAKDRSHYSKDLFRGPMWVNVNWLIAQGFERYGMKDHARTIRAATVREIERTVEKFGVFFEYFDDRREVDPPQLLRKGKCAPEASPYHQVIHDFGWTTTLYVDMVLGQ